MPELPSVEIYKNYFDSTCLKQRIKEVEVRNPEILINAKPQQLKGSLKGQEFISSRRYGKYLFCQLDNGYYLIMHFGMTGYLKYFQKDSPSYIRFLISFQNHHKMAFKDMRKFGKIGLTTDPDQFIYIKNLGPDALEISLKKFLEIFKKRKGFIKPLIMNQNFIAGIGNLYADEILYQSGIHPLTKADKLSREDLKNLFAEMRKVLKKAIEYKDKPYNLPSSFLLPHRHPHGECPSGGPLEILKIAGRTTYFCQDHQKFKK